MVCVGNVCRSPVAERLLRGSLPGVVPEGAVRVESAGVRAVVGSGVDPDAARELERLGGDPAGFAARQLTEGLVADADLVLTATKDVRRDLLRMAPAALHRAFTLPELAALLETVDVDALPLDQGPRAVVRELSRRRASVAREDLDVEDPIGRGSEVHARVAERVLGCLERVLPLVEAVATTPTRP